MITVPIWCIVVLGALCFFFGLFVHSFDMGPSYRKTYKPRKNYRPRSNYRKKKR